MKKILFVILILITILVGVVFGFLFTKVGNEYIASYLENKVNDEQKKVKFKINKFRLTFNTIDLDATVDDDSNINITGDLKLFEKIVDLKYDIKVKELANFEKLLNQKLNGPFYTSGFFKGNEKSATIEGLSDIASSDTNYKIDLINFEPSYIKFLVKNAKIEKFLYMLNEPIYATGKVNVSGNIKNAKIGQLDGNIDAKITRGKLVNKTINKHFKQNIASRIGFISDIKAKLIGNTIEAKSDLITSLADVFLEKTIIDLDKNNIVSDYKMNMKNLSKLQGVIGKKLNGKFTTYGNVVLNNNDIKIDGNSNIFESSTKFDVSFKNSQPKNINFQIKNAKIDKLLHMLNEPVYALGNFVVDGRLTGSQKGSLNGTIDTQILNGKIVNEVVNTVFEQTLKEKVLFDGKIHTNIDEKQAVSNTFLNTSLASLKTNKAVFDFKESSLHSDYLLNVPSLNKLKGITNKKLRGKLDVKGIVKTKSGSLYMDGKSKLLDGDLNFKLKNDNLTAKLKNAQMRKLSYMFYYPEIFDSSSDLNLDYNLLLKKGQINGTLLKGHFLPNNFSSIINQFSKFDLTREIYDTVQIDSKIDNMVLNSIVNMKSKNTQIDVTNSIINLNKNTTNTKIKANIRKIKFAVGVKGKMSNPKISLDTKSLVKSQVKKQINKHEDKLKKKLNKVLGDKLGDDGAKKVLDNFKSLF